MLRNGNYKPIALAVLVVGALPLFGDLQTGQRPLPVFGSNVTLVTVPVFVTDGAGRPIGGLKATDFELEDNGKVVPIVEFHAIDLGEAGESRIVSGELDIAAVPLAVQAASPRQFVILIDMTFSPQGGLLWSRRAAEKYVRDSLAPGDLVAVATSGPGGLRILTNFTTDHAFVAEAIGGSAKRGTPGIDPLGLSSVGLAGVGSFISEPLNPAKGISATGGGGSKVDAELAFLDTLLKTAQTEGIRNTVLGFLSDLRVLIRSVAPLSGRKQIVLFSGGFSEAAWTPPEGTPVLAAMDEVWREAHRADAVIHTIDLAGIPESIDLVSQNAPPLIKSGVAFSAGRDSLVAMSLNTGGVPVRPRGDFGKAIGEMDRVSRKSYVLAFEASGDDSKEDKPRRLKVRVRREGLSVSYRTEYSLIDSAPSKHAGALLASEAISKGLSGGALRLHLATLPYRDGKGETIVHAALRIEGRALAEAARGNTLPVQVYGYAMEGGRVVNGVALDTRVDLSKLGSSVRDEGFTVVTAFPAPSRHADLRFHVRAGFANASGSIQRDVDIPVFSAERVLSPPIFPRSAEGRAVVPFQSAGVPPAKVPFHADGVRFIPLETATLVAGRASDVRVFVWRRSGRSDALIEVRAELVREGNPPRPAPVAEPPRVARDPDGFDRYLVRIVPPSAAAGDWRLRLTFTDPATGWTSSTEAGVTLARSEEAP